MTIPTKCYTEDHQFLVQEAIPDDVMPVLSVVSAKA